jgi:predicted lipid-binding transport protein (Tim44 family)
MRFGTGFRPLIGLCALLAVLAVAVVDADARSRVSIGSRGSKTFTPPPATQTAPNQAQPVERTMAQPSQPANPATTAARPNTPAPSGGLLSRPGLLGGFAAGFIGAGLIGLLLGHGLTGGLAGFASVLGLLLQVGLVVAIGYMLWMWWQRRSQPALAGGPSLRDAAGPQPTTGLNGMGGLSGGASSASFTPTASDFDQFERLLGEIQTAYGAEDLSRLRQHVTPEVLSYYADELAANASRGVLNRTSSVKLLQGDLSEAWHEGDTDYATVAMRYSLNDEIVDRTSGRVIEGGPDEATEVWTFMRTRGGGWLMSAVQQV